MLTSIYKIKCTNYNSINRNKRLCIHKNNRSCNYISYIHNNNISNTASLFKSTLSSRTFGSASPISWLKPKSKKQAKLFHPRGTVCLIGRPNVGKSTLFNKLSGHSKGQNSAIVDPTPGTTRDRKLGKATIAGCDFYILDTPGLDEQYKELDVEEKKLKKSMTEQTILGVKSADMILFLIDGKTGITFDDEHFAKWLRKYIKSINKNIPVILIANKCESKVDEYDLMDAAQLGFGTPYLISAYHNIGVAELFDVINEQLPPLEVTEIEEEVVATVEPEIVNNNDKPDKDKDLKLDSSNIEGNVEASSNVILPPSDLSEIPENELDDELKEMIKSADTSSVDKSMTEPAPMIQLAIVGRPNVGKSTLINAMIGQDRLVVSPVPHTTRDSISVDHEYNGRTIRFVDTAGLSGTSSFLRKNLPKLQGLMMDDAMGSLNKANVCAVVIDIEPKVASSELLTMLKEAKQKKTYGGKSIQKPEYMVRLAEQVFPHIDVTIASKVVDEGRALVLLVNKFDLIEKSLHNDILEGLEMVVKYVLPNARGVPIIPISAIKKYNLHAILPAVVKQFDRWNAKISTNRLNMWMRQLTRLNPPPRVAGRLTKIRFMNQTHARPPHFALYYSAAPQEVSISYMRYVTNSLREEFDLHGVPVRLTVKKSKNPYAPERVQALQSKPKRL